MARPKFDYFAPESIEEACRLCSEIGAGAFVLAGGTDLMVKVNHRLIKPKAFIGLKGIKGLDRISFDKKTGLTIGAMGLLADVASDPAVRRHYPAIAFGAGETANVQIRNMGTVAGNLCNAAPSADNAPALMALDAEVTLRGTEGKRRIPLEHFFKGPGLTAIESGEILTAIHVPPPLPKSGASYQHISARGQTDISAVGVGAMVALNGRSCGRAKIFLGAVAPIPMRAVNAEKLIIGKRLTSELIEKAGLQASRESKPITDMRASAEYRKMMVAVLTKRALQEAQKRAMKAKR
ncbi:FAD binding domain-containing protein [Thermodesulfobacteriota bacterium]